MSLSVLRGYEFLVSDSVGEEGEGVGHAVSSFAKAETVDCFSEAS